MLFMDTTTSTNSSGSIYSPAGSSIESFKGYYPMLDRQRVICYMFIGGGRDEDEKGCVVGMNNFDL